MTGQSRIVAGPIGQIGLGLLAVIVLCLVGRSLEAFGLPVAAIVFLFLIAALAVSLISFGAGIAPNATRRGMAAGIERLSAFGLFGIAGAVFALGHDGASILIGLSAGFVISAILIVPPLDAAPTRSLPDYFSLRYGKNSVRYLSLAIIGITSVIFVAAQLVAIGLIAAQGLGIAPVIGVFLGAVAIFALTIPRLSRTDGEGPDVLVVVVITGMVVAGFWLLSEKTGVVVPQFAYGGLFADIGMAENRLGVSAQSSEPFAALSFFYTVLVIFSIAVGSAVMPHTVGRFMAAESRAVSRQMVRSGLVWFVIVATMLPALGVLARADLLAVFTETRGVLSVDALPVEVQEFARLCAADAKGGLVDCLAVVDGGAGARVSLDPQSAYLALPLLAKSPGWVLALLSMIALIVSIIAGSAATTTLARAVTSRMEPPGASRQALGVVVVTIILSLGLASASGMSVITLGACAIALIGASLFAPFVLGLWWQRASATGALAGMLAGFILTAVFVIGTSWGVAFDIGMAASTAGLGIVPLIGGAFGIAGSLLVTWLVSLVNRETRTNRSDLPVDPQSKS